MDVEPDVAAPARGAARIRGPWPRAAADVQDGSSGPHEAEAVEELGRLAGGALESRDRARVAAQPEGGRGSLPARRAAKPARPAPRGGRRASGRATSACVIMRTPRRGPPGRASRRRRPHRGVEPGPSTSSGTSSSPQRDVLEHGDGEKDQAERAHAGARRPREADPGEQEERRRSTRRLRRPPSAGQKRGSGYGRSQVSRLPGRGAAPFPPGLRGALPGRRGSSARESPGRRSWTSAERLAMRSRSASPRSAAPPGRSPRGSARWRRPAHVGIAAVEDAPGAVVDDDELVKDQRVAQRSRAGARRRSRAGPKGRCAPAPGTGYRRSQRAPRAAAARSASAEERVSAAGARNAPAATARLDEGRSVAARKR